MGTSVQQQRSIIFNMEIFDENFSSLTKLHENDYKQLASSQTNQILYSCKADMVNPEMV